MYRNVDQPIAPIRRFGARQPGTRLHKSWTVAAMIVGLLVLGLLLVWR
jgi:hypothetical protein